MATEESGGFKTEKLTTENYHSWKFNMKMYLIAKDLWEIVQGKEANDENATPEVQRKFRKRENVALATICLSISSNLQIYVRNAKSSKEAWDILGNHFEEKSLSKKIFYRRKLYAARLQKGMDIMAHINGLKTIAEHLESVDDAVVDKDLTMILISSLPDDYNNLITTLETVSEEKLTWAYVRDRVIHEYERKKGGKGVDVISDALFCEQFKKLGQAKGYGKGGKGKKDLSKVDCFYCKKKGHFQYNCPKKKADDKKEKEQSNIVYEKDRKDDSDIFGPRLR